MGFKHRSELTELNILESKSQTRSKLLILAAWHTRQKRFLRSFTSTIRPAKMGESLPEEAPFPLTEVDKWVLSQTDEEFHKHDWQDLKEIIGKRLWGNIYSALLSVLRPATDTIQK